MNSINPSQIAKNIKPKVATPPVYKREPKRPNTRTTRQWVKVDAYDLNVRDIIRLHKHGKLFEVTVADNSPIGSEKVIHCVPTLDRKAKATIFHAYGHELRQPKFVFRYDEVEVEL